MAWLAVQCAKSATAELMRVAWRTMGQIIERVVAETERRVDLLENLQRIGIEEISHRRGQRYITVVIDHDTGTLVWAAPDRDGGFKRSLQRALRTSLMVSGSRESCVVVR